MKEKEKNWHLTSQAQHPRQKATQLYFEGNKGKEFSS